MESSFEQRYLECEKSLYLIAYSYLHNSEDAKDCVQEAAESAYKNYNKLRDKALFKTWLTRILINKAKDLLKKQKWAEQYSDSLDIFTKVPENDMDILHTISSLDHDTAIYITLRFYNDMTYKEVSETLKQPEATVKYRTKSALEQLKKLLEDNYE